jgi:polysaccharide export outer membrane protein
MVALLCGCTSESLVQNNQDVEQTQTLEQVLSQPYKVKEGDVIDIRIYGEEDLSGEMKIDELGQISVPLVGDVEVSGKTTKEIEDTLKTTFSNGLLKDPFVSVSIAEYRPFSILGEVNNAGSYDYQEGMSIAEAVAKAGGFTYRSNKNNFEVLRSVDNKWVRGYLEVHQRIRPGDIIYVRERVF